MAGKEQIQEKVDETYVDEIGQTQPYPKVKLINTLKTHADEVQACIPEKYLKFKVFLDPQKTSNDQIIVRVDTDADVNCMNKITFNTLFPEVKLKWGSHKLQNFGNSAADAQILGEFQSSCCLRE